MKTITVTLSEKAEKIFNSFLKPTPETTDEDQVNWFIEEVDLLQQRYKKKDRSEYDKCVSTKHNSICLARALDDEPIFVLRAKDKTAANIVKKWVEINREQNRQPEEKLKGAENLISEIIIYRNVNKERLGIVEEIEWNTLSPEQQSQIDFNIYPAHSFSCVKGDIDNCIHIDGSIYKYSGPYAVFSLNKKCHANKGTESTVEVGKMLLNHNDNKWLSIIKVDKTSDYAHIVYAVPIDASYTTFTIEKGALLFVAEPRKEE